MKINVKALLLVLCAVALVAAAAFGTLAYLTDSEAVTNTFTVGKVVLGNGDLQSGLDEAKVDEYGVPVSGAARVQANTYKLIPGQSYTKDPTVHVGADSENSYIFVKVDNGIADYEAATVAGGYKNITDQILANGWTQLTGNNNVYYKTYTKGQADRDLEVFEEFMIKTNAQGVSGWDTITAETTKINVTAYAIQQDGFTTAATAWTALQAQLNPPTNS